MKQVSIEITLNGYFCNHWPEVKISLNNSELFVGSIINNKTLIFDVECESINNLTIVHQNKSFGENGIWDTNPETGEDCKVQICDIKFNQVSIGKKIRSELKFITNWSQFQLQHSSKDFIDQYSTVDPSDGWLAFNGSISIEFETPVYDWLIVKKFKINEQNDKAYYSNFTKRWHFEQDLEILDEIRTLMGFDENCCNSRTEA